jgi:Spy/CpxP family protein refolding chaperone
VNTFKETEMNKRMIWVLSAALLSGVSVAAIASNHGMDKQHAGKYQEARITQLEQSLKLQDKQLEAWNAYKKQMSEMAQTQEKNRAAMQASRQALMSQLSPEQQKSLNNMHGDKKGKGKGHDRSDKKGRKDGCQY